MDRNFYCVDSNNDFDDSDKTDLLTIAKIKTKKPKMYKVLLHNDDYTTMEFVVHVLKKFFGKSNEESTAIMLSVHEQGTGVCGVYTHEVAETKTKKINQYSREKGHPLKCSFEAE